MTPGPPGGLLRRAPGSDGGVNALRSAARPVGLFCGLTVVDVIQLVEAPPEPDEKIVALDQLVAAGGPATNAAVAFSALGGRALLAAPVGVGPLADLVRADLAAAGVELIDCAALGPAGTDTPDPTASPAPGLSVSSCTITASTGARSVVSTNARTATDPAALDVYASRAGDGREPPPDVVLIDGHNPALAALALDLAAGADAFTVMDAGSWKDDAADLPGCCDVVAASARFYPPGPAAPSRGLRRRLDGCARPEPAASSSPAGRDPPCGGALRTMLRVVLAAMTGSTAPSSRHRSRWPTPSARATSSTGRSPTPWPM